MAENKDLTLKEEDTTNTSLMADKGSGTTETVSEQEKKWLDALRGLKLNTGDDSPADLQNVLQMFIAQKEKKKADDKAGGAVPKMTPLKVGKETGAIPKNILFVGEHLTQKSVKKEMDVKPALPLILDFETPQPKTDHKKSEAIKQLHQGMKNTAYSFPKLSTFSGDNNKGEVSWDTFKFEIEALIEEYTFTEEQVMLGIRRAVKGTASDIVRRLGTGISVQTVLRKLNSTYGNIESTESVLQKFYSCTQGNDPVNVYAVKLEDIYSQAVELGSMARNETLLKQTLYHGLKLELKLAAQYKMDTISDYDRFKIELRKLEAELKQPEGKKTCYAAQKVDDKKEYSYLESTIMELKEKIERLEKDRTTNRDMQSYGFSSRGYRRPSGPYRGNQGRGDYHRGRGDHSRRRGEYTRGTHFARECNADRSRPQYGRKITCYRCEQQGHYAKDCQTDLKNLNN